MKRQSKAEEALQAQLKSLNLQLNDAYKERAEINVRIETIREIMDQIQVDIDRKKAFRVKTSEAKRQPRQQP